LHSFHHWLHEYRFISVLVELWRLLSLKATSTPHSSNAIGKG
jgi:hypothetical protein